MNAAEIQDEVERLMRAVRAFQEADIRFVLIGGMAMLAHGASALTHDADLAYALDTENRERLATFLAVIHARVSGRPANDGFVITPDLLGRVKFLNLYTDLGVVDVMRDIPGVSSFDNLWENAVPLDLGGFVVRVASLDDLITMKRAANRVKDQTHLLELLALKKMRQQAEGNAPNG